MPMFECPAQVNACNIHWLKLICQVSEGLDFADHAGRAVVVTGMPFATMTDPKVWYSSFFFLPPTLSGTYRCVCH